MMIILAILKWIGLIIAGLLGLVLVAAALILFAPVRYRVMAEYEDSLRYAFRINYLFPLFSLRKKIDEAGVVLYILGIPIKSLPGRKKRGKKEDSTRKEREEPVKQENRQNGENEENREQPGSGEKSGVPPQKSRRNREKKKKKHFSFDRISSIISFIREKETRLALGKVKREIVSLLRYLSPAKAELDFRIGTDDPAMTGLLIGGISLMPFVYQKGIHIVPDFEEKIIRGNGKIKGKIRVIYFIRLVIRVYRDEELKRVWIRMNKKEAA